MYCVSAVSLFLIVKILHCNLKVEASEYREIWDDIYEFNMTCEKDYCSNSTEESLKYENCHCDFRCVHFGTCCLDSDYVDVPSPKFKPACRLANRGDYYFMVDQCSSTDNAWANLCNSEWDGDDDIQKLVPVTSLYTNITYKNYYCFRCHETTDDFLYWRIMLESISTKYNSSEVADKHVLLTYDNDAKEWMASYDGGITSIDVQLSVTASPKIERIIYDCEPNVISDCAGSWTDDDVRSKCHSYMGIKRVRDNYNLSYKNIHCALCNYVSLEDIICRYAIKIAYYKWNFPFTYFLDINHSDKELVSEIQKCSEDYLWDPYARKCRQLTCALPDYKIKNGKCIRE